MGIGTAKGLALDFYQKRKLQVTLEGFCLTEAKAQRGAEKPGPDHGSSAAANPRMVGPLRMPQLGL